MKKSKIKKLPNSIDITSCYMNLEHDGIFNENDLKIMTHLKEMYKEGELPIREFTISVVWNIRLLYDKYSK